jgi:hypothetical protein
LWRSTITTLANLSCLFSSPSSSSSTSSSILTSINQNSMQHYLCVPPRPKAPYSPPFLIPCLASNSHSSFEELGHACVDYLKDLELTCKDGLAISENSHCHALVQFMWGWAAKGTPETEDYWIAVTLLADPRPKLILHCLPQSIILQSFALDRIRGNFQ